MKMRCEKTIVDRVKEALLAIPRRSWENGEAMQAMLELRDYDTLTLLAREVAYSRQEDGRTLIASEWEKRTVTDPSACGEALMVAAAITRDPMLKETLEGLLDYTINRAPRNPDGILYHVNDAPEFWVDSIYMLTPFLAAAGYYDLAIKHINTYWNIFFDEKDHMLHWIWNDEKKEFVRTHYRSICNGYGVCGIVKVACHLPTSMKKERDELMAKAKLLIDGLLKHIDSNGVCHDHIDDPKSIIGINAVSMVTGSIFRMIAAGYLDESYLKLATHLRDTLHAKVDQYGFLYGVCGIPNNNKTGISANGQSFFLMMEAAWIDLQNAPGAWFTKEQGKSSDYVGVLP